MKRVLKIAGMLIAIAAPTAQAQVMNFHNAYNFANYDLDNSFPLYGSMVYSGQGAYSDPGNNVWNGYGGGFPPFPNSGYSPSANGFTTDPTRQPTGTLRYSNGSLSGITLTINYGFDNGGLFNTHNTFQGLPNFILGNQGGVNSGSPGAGTSGAPMGTFTFHNVPAGTYTLYLYGANFDADRGSVFSVASGSAHNGINGTVNNGNNGAFVEGANYVYFENVTPNGSGDISGNFIPNPASTLQGEANFNGAQLIFNPVPEPSSLTLLGLGSAALLIFRRRK